MRLLFFLIVSYSVAVEDFIQEIRESLKDELSFPRSGSPKVEIVRSAVSQVESKIAAIEDALAIKARVCQEDINDDQRELNRMAERRGALTRYFGTSFQTMGSSARADVRIRGQLSALTSDRTMTTSEQQQILTAVTKLASEKSIPHAAVLTAVKEVYTSIDVIVSSIERSLSDNIEAYTKMREQALDDIAKLQSTVVEISEIPL